MQVCSHMDASTAPKCRRAHVPECMSPQGKIMAEPGPLGVGRDVCWTSANCELSLPFSLGAGEQVPAVPGAPRG